MHAPATDVYPDLTPTTPFDPISETMFPRVPTSGRVADVVSTTWAKAGSAMPTAAIRSTSAAVDTVWGSNPEASA